VLRREAVVVVPRRGSVVAVARIVEVDLGNTALQDIDDGIHATQSILILRTTRIWFIERDNSIIAGNVSLVRESGYSGNLHDESNLLRRLHGWTFKHLTCEVSRERNKLACDKVVLEGVPLRAERRSIPQSREVEGGERVKDNDLMGGIGIDWLV
jgi:hypothetical protein